MISLETDECHCFDGIPKKLEAVKILENENG